MLRWADFETAASELAALGRERFERFGFLFVGTVRKDGGPRVNPVEAYVVDGHLVLNMMWHSLKALDLLRDPRIYLHTPITDRLGAPGEFKGPGGRHRSRTPSYGRLPRTWSRPGSPGGRRSAPTFSPSRSNAPPSSPITALTRQQGTGPRDRWDRRRPPGLSQAGARVRAWTARTGTAAGPPGASATRSAGSLRRPSSTGSGSCSTSLSGPASRMTSCCTARTHPGRCGLGSAPSPTWSGANGSAPGSTQPSGGRSQWYARRCVELCGLAAPGDLAEFDLPFTREAMARANAVAGDRAAALEWLELGAEATLRIADPDDRELVATDLQAVRGLL